MDCIVIDGKFKEANRLAILISLGENDLRYDLFNAIEIKIEDILIAMRSRFHKNKPVVVKNVSKETDLTELLIHCNNRIPLIVACDLCLSDTELSMYKRYGLAFQLITINNIKHEYEKTPLPSALRSRV